MNKKRLTKSEKAERVAFVAREKRTREMVEGWTSSAIALRLKEREFHGLEREFLNYQCWQYSQF